ncbi:MAG: chloride channel protein [Methanoregulaceae archaeon]|jgi:H+/Cl- antiporter ClcA|nr:chloride channel protein [Methanoregulaceae archaeon]MCU0629068.1 chloride channel protein [Methanoregulaceae archaeon]
MPGDVSSTRIDEATDSLNTKKFYLLLLFVSVIGAIGALMMIVFFFLEDLFTAIVWNDIPVDSLSPVFNPWILVICILGGLGVGLIRHYFKGEIAIMAEDLVEFDREGRFSLKRGIELFFRGLVSLVCGAPLGPEAPLTVSTGAAGTLIAEKARMPPPLVTLASLSAFSGFFGAFLTSPFGGALILIEVTLEKGKMTWKAILPSIVAATAGFAVYFLLSGTFMSGMFTVPPYGGFKNIDLVYAIFLGLLGGVTGIFFIILYKKMRGIFEPWENRPVLLGLLGGLGLGIAGILLPLTLFMGGEQLQVLINNYLEVSLLMLLVLIVVKILLITFSFSTGFAGGYIFPGFFIGGTLGILVFKLFPFIPLAVCLVCVISGVSVALLRSPIALAMIIAIVFEPQLVPAMAIALVMGFVVSYRYSLPYTRKISRKEG